MQEPFDVLLSGQPDKPVPPPVKQRRPFATRASIIATVVVAGLLATGGVFGLKYRHVAQTQQNLQAGVQPTAAPSSAAAAAPTSLPADTVTLDPAKDYGNKYADGILPVGDKQYSTASAQKGKVYLCNANFVPESQAGAQLRGPWFTNNNTEWDINKKVAVDGSINWEQQLDITVADGKRTITTNDLPDHHTGVFPVSSSDDAYTYDRNPNTISDQSITYTLTELPTFGEPQCMGGEAGIMLTGAALFNAFDAGGRDAGAWEVQDTCDGHPQSAGEYHYHTLSRCITDISVKKVIGFALDGFPITGPTVGENNILTTDDLDECHGIVSEIELDGRPITMYHYVLTQDFPYSVSCFRANAIQPPGQPEGQAGQAESSPSPAPSAGQSGGQRPPKPPQGGPTGGTPPQ